MSIQRFTSSMSGPLEPDPEGEYVLFFDYEKELSGDMQVYRLCIEANDKVIKRQDKKLAIAIAYINMIKTINWIGGPSIEKSMETLDLCDKALKEIEGQL